METLIIIPGKANENYCNDMQKEIKQGVIICQKTLQPVTLDLTFFIFGTMQALTCKTCCNYCIKHTATCNIFPKHIATCNIILNCPFSCWGQIMQTLIEI